MKLELGTPRLEASAWASTVAAPSLQLEAQGCNVAAVPLDSDYQTRRLPIPLLVLCLLLMLVQPVNVGLTAARALDGLAVRGLPAVLVLLLRLLAAALGVGAGRSLLARRAGAVKLAKTALAAGAAADLVLYLTPYFPGNRAPGETPVLVAFSLTYYSGWWLYLSRSRRVSEALGSD